MDVQFVTSVAPIVRDAKAARSFYQGDLGLFFEGEEGDYVFTQQLEGTKHFGLWPLSEAANACFGTPEWPAAFPVPQASIEFEVSDVAAAAAELTAKGHRLIHEAHTEPWG
jgi:catechol 2,3-dioxygenase-like lactoylglutathione lyase family enzyme